MQFNVAASSVAETSSDLREVVRVKTSVLLWCGEFWVQGVSVKNSVRMLSGVKTRDGTCVFQHTQNETEFHDGQLPWWSRRLLKTEN